MLDLLGSLALLALRILKLLLMLSWYLCNVARVSHYSMPFHENQINAYLRTGARYICYYSSFCSYRESCQLVGSNITFNFVLFCGKSGTTVLTGLMLRIYQPFQGSEILVFQLLVKQPIKKGGFQIHLCLKEMKLCIVPFLRNCLSLTIV